MNDYLFDKLADKKGQILPVKVDFVFNEKRYVDYIQGILKEVSVENQSITIEQHIPFINLVYGKETVKVDRELKITEFELLENLKL